MSFVEWCAQPWAAGRHRFDQLPLPALHPLTHGQFAIEFDVTDARVTRCRFEVAGSHRGDEKLLEVRDFKQGLALVNRHSWLTPSFAETLYARIIEQALGLVVSPRAAALRTLAMALNAAAAEAYWQAVDSALTGDQPDLRERERILTVFELLTGARIHPTYVRIGGVAADIDDADVVAIRQLDIPEVNVALDTVDGAVGDIAVTLPKVLRLPHGDYFDEIDSPHGVSAMWVFGNGDKVPHRVHLRPAGVIALAHLERAAIGMPVQDFLHTLATTRLVLGEVAR